MSYKKWLYEELLERELITEEDFESIDVFNEEDLLQTTEVESFDLEEFASEFANHCKLCKVEPIWDFE